MLLTAGFSNVTGWTSPRAALASCLADPPDLILLDYRMPDLDGIALLRALRQQLPAAGFVPVLVLTADTARDSKKAALGAGATDFLAKPFDRDEVLLRVGNLLHTRALFVQVQGEKNRLQAGLDAWEARRRQRTAERQQRVERLERIVRTDALSTVIQPIKNLSTLDTVGVEALTRIAWEPTRAPDIWFAEAATLGMGLRFELAAIVLALPILDFLPGNQYLSVNASPSTAESKELAEILPDRISHRIVVEITEHVAVDHYETLSQGLDGLRARGVRIAIDDAGAGYAGLQHILKVRPDIIKLDRSLTSSINSDPARRALASAVVRFGREVAADIVAEGIETVEEFDQLQALGVPWGQGYYLGKPEPPCSSSQI
jgi:EAL domain-containing protein (putative c-di-GMP-specific phosphodiesterase class I)/FixJ family two-component response regulator